MRVGNQKGLSLVETLLAVGITGFLGLIISGQLKIASTDRFEANIRDEVAQSTMYIESLLEDPHTCSYTVAGINMGTIAGVGPAPRMGEGVGGDFQLFRKAVPRPGWTPFSGGLFYIGDVNLFKTESNFTPNVPPLSDNIVVERMQLLNDGHKDFIRITMKPHDRLLSFRNSTSTSKLSLSRDFFIKAEKTIVAGNNRITRCSYDRPLVQQREMCAAQNGTWDEVNSRCVTKDMVQDPIDKKPIWIMPSGVITTDPPLTHIGNISCRCNRKRCSRAPMPCTCALNCNASFGTCSGQCRVMRTDNYDSDEFWFINRKCMYRHYCGRPSSPEGYMVEPIP